MKPHVKIYLTHFGYDETSFIPCEICHQKAVDIHHIECRGMGGTKQTETIENLMALCRTCHTEFGDISELKQKLIEIHTLKLNRSK